MDGRVLCVDPDPDERAATAEALQEAGFAVTAVGRLDAAREALDKRPDCLVVETTLPDGDGLSLVEAARERDPDVGVVLFTAAEYGEVETDRIDHVVEVLPKRGPNAVETLVTFVETTVAERTQTDYPLPDDEDERLAALASYDLDAAATRAALDRLTTLATGHFDVSMASVNIIAEDEQRLLACKGLEAGTMARSESVCTFTIVDDGATVVEDVREDPRFADNDALRAAGIRAYAGARLVTPGGAVIGSFCLYDEVRRSFTPEEVADLERFAAEAVEQLELRRLAPDAPGVRVEPGGDG